MSAAAHREPAPNRGVAITDDLLAALERLGSEEEQSGDLALLRAALAGGRITLASGASIAAGGDIRGSILITGDGNTVSLSADLLARLQPPEYQPPPPPDPGELSKPGELPPGSTLPFSRNNVFTGRGSDLLNLARALLHKPVDRAALVVSGIGGVGKTQLAVEFCHRYGRYFNGVHWVPADQDIAAGIAVCGAAMGIQPWPEKVPEQVAATLRAWGTGGPRLVIFDNLEDPLALHAWLPRLDHARLLVTARRGVWPRELGVTSLPIEELERAESRALLRKLAPRLEAEPDGELDRIAERLGDLPLALTVAGRYLDVRGRLSIAGYLQELEQAGGALQHLPLPDWLRDSPTRHELSLWETFLVSWRQLEGEGAELEMARRLLRTCGYCAPNAHIPLELLAQAVGGTEGELSWAFDLGLRRLLELGLVAEETGGVSVHPLIGEFGRAQDRSLEGDEESALVNLVNAMIELGEAANDSGLPERFKPLRAHMTATAPAAETAGLDQAGRLWNALGRHLDDVAEYAETRAVYERALAIDEQVYGPDHPQVATGVNNLGLVLRALGDLQGARAAFERAIDIWERTLDPEHPQVATGVNNLGSVLRDLGDLQGARAAYERALAIDERVYGSDHPTVATDVNNLGGVLQALGDLPGARAAFERAVAIDERVYGPDHPTVATHVNNLGLVLQDLGDLPGARAAFERALAIDERVYGSDHPKVAVRVNNLGLVLRDLGDLQGARAAYERALAIDERVFGPDHPIIANRINNLGSVLLDLGDLPGARAAAERALTILQNSLPPNHPHIDLVKSNLESLAEYTSDNE